LGFMNTTIWVFYREGTSRLCRLVGRLVGRFVGRFVGRRGAVRGAVSSSAFCADLRVQARVGVRVRFIVSSCAQSRPTSAHSFHGNPLTGPPASTHGACSASERTTHAQQHQQVAAAEH